jgi:hypothetical protein
MMVAAASSCRHNLTEPSSCVSSCCSLPSSARAQGSGWVEGDLVADSFAGPHAQLHLATNSSKQLPALTVVVKRFLAGRLLPRVIGRGQLAGSSFAATEVTLDIRDWRVGEHMIAIFPDKQSQQAGWCGQLNRFVRKTNKATSTGSAAAVTVETLRIGQPVLFLDDRFIAERRGVVRRVIPAIQQRISNDSFCSRRHPWMKIDRGPSIRCSKCPLSFGMKVNYGNSTGPLTDPASEAYDCSGVLGKTDDGSRQWTCLERGSSKSEETATAQHRPAHNTETTTAWPPRSAPSWPLASTAVRHYDSRTDGPVDITQMSVFYTYHHLRAEQNYGDRNHELTEIYVYMN